MYKIKNTIHSRQEVACLSDLFYMFRPMEKRKEKSDIKLWELEKGTMVSVGENKHIMEFLGIDGMYARRKPSRGEVIIMGHANQKVSEYGEIIA